MSQVSNADNCSSQNASSNHAEQTPSKPYRLRNSSYQQATGMSLPSDAITSQTVEDNTTATEVILEESFDMGSMEDIVNPVPMIRKEDWQGKNNATKLDSVFEAVNKMYAFHQQYTNRLKPLEYAVFHKTDGILPQLGKITTHAKDSEQNFSRLIAENLKLRDELEIVKGVVHKQGKQIHVLQHRLADQTARSMANNITISGLLSDGPGLDTGDCRIVSSAFLVDELGIDEDVVENGLLLAHRLGIYVKDRHRAMVIKVTPDLAKIVFENAKKLKDKVNSSGGRFSINPQLPDMLAEQRREIRQIIKDKKASEAHLDAHSKSSFLVRNGRVYINGQCQRKQLVPPNLLQMFVDVDEQAKIDKISFKTQDSKQSRGSRFRAFATTVESMNEVHLAYIKMFQNNPSADHIIAAFVCGLESGFQDDAEFGAGYRLLQVLRDSHIGNIAVFITRDFGGEHLGPLRFQIMRDLAVDVIAQLN